MKSHPLKPLLHKHLTAIDKYISLLYTCFMKTGKRSKNRFEFFATVSDRGQIFIPKPLQNYFQIKNRDKVRFIVEDDGRVVFLKKEGRS